LSASRKRERAPTVASGPPPAPGGQLTFTTMKGAEMAALVADCPPAKTLYGEGGARDFSNCFHIANQLHLHGRFAPAARFYRRSLDQYPVGTGYHPLENNLLSAQMLCELKGGFIICRQDLDRLLLLDRAQYCFICGCIELFKSAPDHGHALMLMGNAFEAFVCGHEAHCYFIKAAVNHFRTAAAGVSMPNPWGAGWTRSIAEHIPRRLFFYWDKDPPAEIRDNFDHHASIREIVVDTYSQQRAEAFLYDYYGADIKDFFIALRHPAEQADFLRPHLVYAYGGYYLDADLRIGSLDAFLQLASSSHEAMFCLTDTYLVDNGFFGAERNSPLMAACIDVLLANCHHQPRLPIDMKTGPGAFTRALARAYFRVMAFGDPVLRLKLVDRNEWRQIIETYPVTYKGDARYWQVFQAQNGIA
jgi:hypothetical protein